MKKSIKIMAFVFFVAVVFIGSSAMAKNGKGNGKNGPAGNSNTGHLYLYEKIEGSWDIVENGAWGKMKYDLSGPKFEFVFNGHGLEPGRNYTLIYYPDPWPGGGLICLGAGLVNEEGDIHIMGSVDTGDLPADYDLNASEDTLPEGDYCYTGAKIWLVLSDDVDCIGKSMTAWNPQEYLFEDELITFDDIDNDTNEGE